MDKLEYLNTLKERIELNIVALDHSTKEQQRTLSKLHIELKGTLKDIEDIENNVYELNVSDHCLVRYLQRIDDFDFSVIKKDIVTKGMLKEYLSKGDGKYFNDKLNCFVCIKNDVVTTLHFDDYNLEEEIEL